MENYLLFLVGPPVCFVVTAVVLGTIYIVIPNWRAGRHLRELGWRRYFRLT